MQNKKTLETYKTGFNVEKQLKHELSYFRPQLQKMVKEVAYKIKQEKLGILLKAEQTAEDPAFFSTKKEQKNFTNKVETQRNRLDKVIVEETIKAIEIINKIYVSAFEEIKQEIETGEYELE
jgi:hypothetical protein